MSGPVVAGEGERGIELLVCFMRNFWRNQPHINHHLRYLCSGVTSHVDMGTARCFEAMSMEGVPRCFEASFDSADRTAAYAPGADETSSSRTWPSSLPFLSYAAPKCPQTSVWSLRYPKIPE